MKSAILQEITPKILGNRIARYNRKCQLGSVLVFIISLICWLVSLLLAYHAILWLHGLFPAFLKGSTLADSIGLCLVAICLESIVYFQPTLFWTVEDSETFGSETAGSMRILSPLSGVAFLLLILCIAPILMNTSFQLFEQQRYPSEKEIQLACRLLAHLQMDEWILYPKLESQRQGITLLYELRLVQVSRRWGQVCVRLK